MMKNLFDYATKELSQDAFLRWLFENYNCENESIKNACRKLFDSFTNNSDEFKDKTIIAQMGKPDMRVPIQYAITYPNKKDYVLDESLDLNKLFNLTLKQMDFERYPLLKLAYEVGKLGGVKPTIFNASNEEAVNLFINKKIKFLEIETIIIDSVNKFGNIVSPTLDQILKIDKEVREYVRNKYCN